MATWIGSPNFSAGRSQPISKVIVHWIVGNLAAADAVFRNPGSQVSAHYGVEDGTIHAYVDEKNTAWHARQANPFSIGIEHSAAPGRPATEATYQTSGRLIAEICKRYGLDPNIAVEPHNKYVATQCPGTMDLNKLKQIAYNHMKGTDVSKDALTNPEVEALYRFGFFRGADPSAQNRYAGKPISFAVDEWNRSTEHQTIQNNLNAVGRLVNQVAALESASNLSKAELVKRNEDLAKKAQELQAAQQALEVERAKKSEDTTLLDETGGWLTKLLNRLFKRS